MIEEVKMLSGMPDSATFHTLYTLWMGGFLIRTEWNAAFSENKLAAIKSAKLELKREAEIRESEKPVEKFTNLEPEKQPEAEQQAEPVVEEGISLDDYLARSENAKTHYEMLGIDVKAEMKDVKQSYFALAKRFHPDHFHHVMTLSCRSYSECIYKTSAGIRCIENPGFA